MLESGANNKELKELQQVRQHLCGEIDNVSSQDYSSDVPQMFFWSL